MQEKIFSPENCLNLDSQKQKECREKQKTLIYQCHAGLTEVIIPVAIYGNIVGYVIIGQFRMQHNPPSFIQEPELAELFMAQKYISFQELDHVLEMFRTLLEYITEKELISTPSDYRLLKLNSYIDKNLLNNITLKNAAKYMNCSISGLSHYLQEKHNTTLNFLIRNKRIQYAETLMKKHPELNLSEIAALAGFNDSHYFSRVYHQLRGVSPKEYRNRL